MCAQNVDSLMTFNVYFTTVLKENLGKDLLALLL